MIRLILKPLLVLITLATLFMALFQVSGRLMFAYLDELEPAANQWLSDQNVEIYGLRGDWRWWDPVVRISRVDLPAGHLEGIYLELDWLESLLRNRPVARRAALADGRLLLERHEGSWRLVGAGAGAAGFNPLDTLYHSDQINVHGSVGFVDENGELHEGDSIDVRYLASNRGGKHRHRLSLETPAGCAAAACELDIAFDSTEPIVLVRKGSRQLQVTGRDLGLPGPLVGHPGGRIAALSANWWQQGASSGGAAALAVDDIGLADGERLSASFKLVSRGRDGVHDALLSDVGVSVDDVRLALPQSWLKLEDGTLRFWMDELALDPVAGLVAELVAEETPVHRWLAALDLRASARNIHGLVTGLGGAEKLEIGYAATVQGVNLEGFNGAPWLRGGSGELVGYEHGMQLSLNTDDLGLQFPDIFRQRWVMDHLQGRLQAWFAPDYFGLRGTNLRAEINGSHASGGFSLTRPADRYGERLTLLVNVDETTVSRSKGFIPYRLPAGLPEWLDNGPRAGLLENVAFAYHGQIHTRPFETARRVEFSADIRDGHVQYHPDWPDVWGLNGAIAVAGSDVRIRVDEGQTFRGTKLSNSRIRLGDNAAFVDIDLKSDTSAAEVLQFVRETPLAEWLTFVTPDWTASGPLSLDGSLHIPLKTETQHIGEPVTDDLAVDLDIALAGVDLSLPSYKIELDALAGEMRYVYPYAVSGADVGGRIFDRPAVFAASSDDDTVNFQVNGQAPYESVLKLLDIADPGIMRGGFDFLADLHIELGDGVSRLDVESDLTGLALDLPGEFAKQADDAVASELELRFLDDYQAVSFRHGSAQGWLHLDGVPLRGAIGFRGPPPLVESTGNELVLGGEVAGFKLEEVVPEASGKGGTTLALPVRLAGLRVDYVDVDGIVFANPVLDGTLETDRIDLAIRSPDLQGRLGIVADKPLHLDLDLLRLPAAGEDTVDPLNVSVIRELPEADLTIRRFLAGGVDYGAWSFQLRPQPGGVYLRALDAAFRGVQILADKVYWDGADNRTYFDGSVTAGNLAEVLPLWDYAPSVATESAIMTGTLEWPGSPAAVDLDVLVGEATFVAKNGRFLEVESGSADALRIFSLVNFTRVVKRLNFDFSDVVGEGVSFDSLTATALFDSGTMQFLEPMTVKGSGSSFRVAGTVDLESGALDNEMIVTLPVSKSLPWYAAYIAIANPLAGLGVLVGERVLRKPLEQFSSAKYQISGTLDEPAMTFVGVWDTRMDQPRRPVEAAAKEDVIPEHGPVDAPLPEAGAVQQETSEPNAVTQREISNYEAQQ